MIRKPDESMMSKTKRWIVAGLIAALGFAAVVVGLFWVFVIEGGRRWDRSLPVYRSQQTNSSHPVYRRTTVTSGSAVYVQDYEEYGLRLVNPEPTNAIGRSAFGNGKICSIPGQNPTNYIAVDCGSEMPAYEVFRNNQQPPFDWRAAKFQTLEFTGTIGLQSHKRSADPALIEDFVRTLREGTPTTAPLTASIMSTNIAAVHLVTDQLPGLVFSPHVYRDGTGSVYLAESFAVEFTNRTTRIHARWIPASPLFTTWLQTP